MNIREKVRSREYVVTYHARIEMNNDNLSIFDVERGVLNGSILERQKDELSNEWKYRIIGKTINNIDIEIICKLSITNKLVIITVYKA
jgi:hypothetical protein